ncbi:unnamed protein product [Mytilus edulis]|uniref:Uncharacterized protein n=1 Tax=Mytilus edulis TaxID=6550 RepID=A0A8S3Q4Q6_MYTED|nr:unnamed protein product [Mytilus edulis]
MRTEGNMLDIMRLTNPKLFYKKFKRKASPKHAVPLKLFHEHFKSLCSSDTDAVLDDSQFHNTDGIGARPKVFKDIEVPNQLKPHDIQIVKENPVNLSDKKSPGKAPGTSMSKRRDIKVATYDGSGDWNDYRSHFEACSSINGWDNLEKGLYLAASLRGQAQGVLGDLSDDKKSHFDQLVRSLEERFAPPNQSELYRVQLKERKQRASETLPELGQTIRRLVNKAYPTAPGEVKETLAKEHFLDALINTEMRATVSLVSDTLFEKLKSRDRPSVRQVTQEIIAANGESLKIIGKALFSLKLGSFHTVIEGVIAGLSVEGILGLDFLQTNGCKVDLGNKVMERDNQHIPLLLQGKLGVYRVAVKDKVSIAPRSEVVIQGEVLNYDSAVQVTGIIEPSEEFLDRGKALVGKSVVMSDKTVPVRLLNISDSVQVLNVGTVVGNLSGAEVVSQVDNDEDCTLSNYLQKIINRSSKILRHRQKDKVTELILKFKHLFASSDSDLGQTIIEKHRIDTGAAKLIKQPPRRTLIGGKDDDLQLDIRYLQEIGHAYCHGMVDYWLKTIVLTNRKTQL